MSYSVVCSLWGCQHFDWCCLDSRGAFDGILLMWNRRVVEKIDECVGEFIIACSIRNVEDHFTWAFAGVCPNSNGDRRLLWDELADLLNWWNIPRCIEGDFNFTRFPGERSGGGRFSLAMAELSDFIFH